MKPNGIKIKMFGLVLPFFLTICTMVVFIACEKEKEEEIEHYQMVNVQEYDVLIYTENGVVQDHNYGIDNVHNKDFYLNHLIDKIIIRNKTAASFYFPVSENKEALDFIHSYLSVTFQVDSIFFRKVLIVDDFDIDIDTRGTLMQNEILIKGILYEYKFENTGYEGGIEYYPYSVPEIVNKYWGDNFEFSPLDTLALYPFELVFAKTNR